MMGIPAADLICSCIHTPSDEATIPPGQERICGELAERQCMECEVPLCSHCAQYCTKHLTEPAYR